MNEWDSLPNGKHIDQVLEDVRARPEVWGKAQSAVWTESGNAKLPNPLPDVHATERAAARKALLGNGPGYSLGPDTRAAWAACTALLTWDDCGYMLDMPTDALKVLAEYHPAAVLMLPANVAFSMKEKT